MGKTQIQMAGRRRKALWEMMVKKWRQNAVDKEEYANVIKKAKAL